MELIHETSRRRAGYSSQLYLRSHTPDSTSSTSSSSSSSSSPISPIHSIEFGTSPSKPSTTPSHTTEHQALARKRRPQRPATLQARATALALGTLMVVLGVAFALLEKGVADRTPSAHSSFAVQIAVMGITSAALEAFAHSSGSDSPRTRTDKIMPLAGLNAASAVFGHWARAANSVHGTYQVVHAFLPIAVAQVSGSGRAFAAVISAAVAGAVWAPAYQVQDGWRAVGVASAVLSLLSVAIQAVVLVRIARHFGAAHAVPTADFMRHYAPLSMVALLVAWPLVESPGTGLVEPGQALSVVLVASVGAAAHMVRMLVVRNAVAGGAVGAAVVMQAKTLVCLAVGWWAYGYVCSTAQVVGFCSACALIVVWIGTRLWS